MFPSCHVRVIWVSLIFLLTALSYPSAVRGAEVSFYEHVLIREDFTNNPLANLNAFGSVVWMPGSLHFRGRAGISISLTTGPKLVASFRIAAPDTSPMQASQINFQVTFQTPNADTASLIVLYDRTQSTGEVLIAGRRYGSTQVVRRFALSRELAGDWTVTFNYGVIEAEVDGQPVVSGYADTGYDSPISVVIGVTSGNVTLNHLVVTSLARPPKNPPPQMQHVGHDMLYRQGRVAQALELARKHLSEVQDGFGEDSPQMSAVLNNVGTYLSHLGDGRAAREYLEKASQLAVRIFGENHPDTAAALSGIAGLLVRQRDFAAASAYYRRILAIVEHVLGPEDPRTAKAYGYMGGILADMQQHAEAVPYLERQLTIYREMFGESDRHIGPALIQLGEALAALGRYAEGQQHVETTLAIYREQLEPDDIEIALTHNVLGHILARSPGGESDAVKHLLTAADMCRKILGPYHQNTAIVLSNLGYVYQRLGRNQQAYEALRDAFEASLHQAAQLIPILSDSEALIYVGQVYGYGRALLALANHAPAVTALEKYRHALRGKAILERLLSATRSEAITGDSEQAEQNQRLRFVKSTLAALLYHRTSADLTERKNSLMSWLVTEKDSLERAIRRQRPRALNVIQADPWNALLKLPNEVALVDLVLIDDGRRAAYGAFVVVNDDKTPHVAYVDLDDASVIDNAIVAWRQSIESGMPFHEVTAKGRLVRQFVWDKIEGLLGGRTQVVVIPEGRFADLPWAAIPARQANRYLLNDYAFAVSSHAESALRILELPGFPLTSRSTLLVGDVEYQSDAAPPPKAGSADVKATIANATQHWMPLPGTRAEIEAIAGIRSSESVTVLRARQATKERVTVDLPGQRYAHFATHGVFVDAQAQAVLELVGLTVPASFGGFSAFGPRSTVSTRNPLLLSALVFAGADGPGTIRKTGGTVTLDQGILTAEEIVGLPLNNTELVVLSACQSALGEIARGEGVLGLQRAFAFAGVRATIGTLWSVGDASTAAVMAEFYANLWTRGLPKLRSFAACTTEGTE